MKASEHDVRELLRQRASEFSMAPQPPADLRRRARLRRSRTVVVAGVAVIALGVVVAPLVRPSGAPDRAAVSSVPAAPSGRTLKAVSYLLADPAGDEAPHAHAKDGPAVTLAELRRHARCMRSNGFDVPDPTQTADGWTITLDPDMPGLDSPRFREAMFVACGPLGGPLSGSLVLGGQSQAQVDRFVSCMRKQGFDLLRPSRQPNGDHVFDLRRTRIDTSLPAWNRALFVTCSPRMP